MAALTQSTANRRPIVLNNGIVFSSVAGELLENDGTQQIANNVNFLVFSVEIIPNFDNQQTTDLQVYTLLRLLARNLTFTGSFSTDVNNTTDNYRRIQLRFNNPYAVSGQLRTETAGGAKNPPSGQKMLGIYSSYGTGNYDLSSLIHATGITRLGTKGADVLATGNNYIGFDGAIAQDGPTKPILGITIHEFISINENQGALTYGALSNANAEKVRQYLINKWGIVPVDFANLPE